MDDSLHDDSGSFGSGSESARTLHERKGGLDSMSYPYCTNLLSQLTFTPVGVFLTVIAIGQKFEPRPMDELASYDVQNKNEL